LLKVFKILIFAAFIIVIFCSLTLKASALNKIVYQRYHILYEEGDSLLAVKLAERLEEKIDRIENFFGGKQRSIVTIYITDSDEEYFKYASRAVPEWSQAVAFPKENLVVLKLKSAEEIKNSLKILLHELVHINLANHLLSRRIPVWLNEGLAQYLSGEDFSFNDKVILSNALLTKKIIKLQDIDSLTKFNKAKAHLAYAQSISAVEFFIREHGAAEFQSLIQDIPKYRSIDAAFKNFAGGDLLDFELNWYADLRERYRWMAVLNFDNLIWVFMGFLALLAIAAVKYRNKKKLRDWEENEEFDSWELDS